VRISLKGFLLQQFIQCRQIKKQGTFGLFLFVVSLPAVHINGKLVLHKLNKSKNEDLIRPILLAPSSEWPMKTS